MLASFPDGPGLVCHPPSLGGGVATLRNGVEPVKGSGGGYESTMFARIAPGCPGRVLALVPASRYVGAAAVDHTGLLPGSFATWNLEPLSKSRHRLTVESRTRTVQERLADALGRYRPSAVVVGVPRFDNDCTAALREGASRLARAHGVVALSRPVADARALLLGHVRGPRLGAVAARLATGFFPELGMVSTKGEAARYHRHSFTAAALAVLVLLERAPLSAAVIARDEAFAMGTFNAALMASARRHFPDNL